MSFMREVNRLLMGVLIAFALVALAAAYWAVIGPDTILRRDDNPRLVEAEASILRGIISDHRGEVLVESLRHEAGLVTRHYVQPAAYSALGYFSLRYGVGGAEAAYNAILRGDDVIPDPVVTFGNALLHLSRRGSDIRLTLDLSVQQRLADAMDGQTGAGVVLSVPGGEILAMVSLPTYDPNTLDANWDRLITEPGRPFFNRVLQGNYQPGGALETALMSAALLVDLPLDEPIEAASAPYQLDDLTLTCAVRLPPMPLTLREAYAFACPTPFASLAETLGLPTIEATFDTLRLEQPPTLPGFLPTLESTGAPTPQVTPFNLTEDNLVENALGQGNLTITPLTMAVVAGGIINDGNAPQPYALAATRAPGEDWTPVPSTRPTLPIATANTARALQDLMRSAVATGAAQNAGRPGMDIGGHVAMAHAGDTSLGWFVGFATLDEQRSVVVAIVLENSSDLGLAADIGGTAMQAAQQALK